MTQHILGIIGGSGLYEIDGLSDLKEEVVRTPFGDPSAPIMCGTLAGTQMLFLPRHGRKHGILPSEINYRANICALKTLGAQWCISVSAVGSLQEHLAPGTIGIPDQAIDRTYRRVGTFFGEGLVAHVSFAEPYCPVLREILLNCGKAIASKDKFPIHAGGTYVCMEGPAFSTRAESLLHKSWGASYIGMTNLPEAKLAREAEIAYATLALVTDYDCWKADGHDVDIAMVLKLMKTNSAHAKKNCRVGRHGDSEV